MCENSRATPLSLSINELVTPSLYSGSMKIRILPPQTSDLAGKTGQRHGDVARSANEKFCIGREAIEKRVDLIRNLDGIAFPFGQR